MSPWNAPATWASTVATFAFPAEPIRRSSRPSGDRARGSPVRRHRRRRRRRGPAAASRARSGIASSSPTPMTWGASRAERSAPLASGPKAGFGDGVVGTAQLVAGCPSPYLPAVVTHRTTRRPSGGTPWMASVLELAAVGRLRSPRSRPTVSPGTPGRGSGSALPGPGRERRYEQAE
jgi:hypothetical protein